MVKDTPLSRGYDWMKLSEKKRSQADYCERCETSFSNPIGKHTHHIVPGKELEIERARSDFNLTVICDPCHKELERRDAVLQNLELGRWDVFAVLDRLSHNDAVHHDDMYSLIDVSRGRIDSILSAYTRMGVVKWSADGSLCYASAEGFDYPAVVNWSRAKCHADGCDSQADLYKREHESHSFERYCRECAASVRGVGVDRFR